MYYTESSFWMNLLLLLSVVFVLWFLFNILIRKWLQVERKKFFSYNHVNEKHKKIDWTIRIITSVVFMVGFFITYMWEPADISWFIQPWFILVIFIIVSELVTAVMERKYAENPNAYKFTVSQVIFLLIVLFTLYITDFFGLLVI
ncbi:DUF4181 domain-containing protein [Alkalihalobacterium bogoriense]|uniref:DUF4181 domain-containing protein n=1 Tax=Alkalihalobacterium bogoriense TaxID=246272 RepID=UPI00047C5DFC|nr:DUF4181 domain-containing protein [Alkalihalobacterium bogoriense]